MVDLLTRQGTLGANGCGHGSQHVGQRRFTGTEGLVNQAGALGQQLRSLLIRLQLRLTQAQLALRQCHFSP